MLEGMRVANSNFYAAAVAIGNHPWIEFAGLQAEYIKLCEAAHKKGIDFTQTNRHTGVALPAESFQIAYLSEKLDCIFSGAIVATPGRGAIRASGR